MRSPIKTLIAKNYWARAFNSWLKCSKTKSVYKRTLSHYAETTHSASENHHKICKLKRSLSLGTLPRVFFVGTDEQQDKSGFYQALQKVSDTKPFLRTDGSWGQNDPAQYHRRRKNNTETLWKLLLTHQEAGWTPDLLIAQTWGCLLEASILSRVREAFGTVIINISMDDRHQYWGRRVGGKWDGTYALIPHIDLALTAAPEAVEWYKKEGVHSIYFPEASDPDIFRPFPELGKTIDVVFVGSKYGIREKIVGGLRQAGIRVCAYGNGWDDGRLCSADLPKVFARSKVVLGVSAIGHCPDFVALKMRDFDGPMSGSCYLTQHNRDLESLYEIGREIVTYNTIDQCISHVRQLLNDEAKREEIARLGRRRALRDHTWSGRFSMLWKTLGIS